MNLVIHEVTARHLEDLAANPSHALLFVGPDGSGKTALAQKHAAELLDVPIEQLDRYPYYLLLQPTESGTVSINTVRDMQKFLQLKTTGQGTIRRVICLEHADGLTQAAQNALLKQLEEPPADTVIILTAQSKRALLPTIISRVQVIHVHPPKQADLEAFFNNNSQDDVRRAYFLSGGLPGLMAGILAKNHTHPLVAQVTVAKELLQKTMFERLSMVDELGKQKDILPQVLEALERIAASGLKQAGVNQDQKAIKRWHVIQKEVFNAQEALARSVSSKLVLTNLFLNF